MAAGPVPNYFSMMKLEVRRILHALNNQHGITASNARFLADQPLTMTTDQAEALRDAVVSAERTAELLRELQAVLG